MLGADDRHRLQLDADTPIDDLIAALKEVRASCPSGHLMTVAVKDMLIAKVLVITTKPKEKRRGR